MVEVGARDGGTPDRGAPDRGAPDRHDRHAGRPSQVDTRVDHAAQAGQAGDVDQVGDLGRRGCGGCDDQDEVVRLLDLARRRLHMDLAWLSRFSGDSQVIDVAVGDSDLAASLPGCRFEYHSSYCARVLDGRLPPLVPNARADSRTADLPITAELRIGAYVGAPVVLPDGQVYGMLCCLSHEPEERLRERDAKFLEVLAEVLSDSVEGMNRRREDRERLREKIGALIDRGGPTMIFQPVFDLPTHCIVGAEALARFPDDGLPPARWFADAAAVGMGVELNLAAIRGALAALPRFPRGLLLAVNASPATIASGRLADLFMEEARDQTDQLIVEITEQEGIEDLASTVTGLDKLRDMGVRIAVDNVGVAYASLARLVQIRPEVMKMSPRLTSGVGMDPARLALVEALVHFSRRLDSCLVASGVERPAELRALLRAGVDQAQGDLLAPPGPLPLPVHGHAPIAATA